MKSEETGDSGSGNRDWPHAVILDLVHYLQKDGHSATAEHLMDAAQVFLEEERRRRGGKSSGPAPVGLRIIDGGRGSSC